MKKIALLFLILFFVLAFSEVAMAFGIDRPTVVRTPLDGGLLFVLAGAGMAYFAARKKKGNQ
jgi:hypothetical protein